MHVRIIVRAFKHLLALNLAEKPVDPIKSGVMVF